MKFKNTIKSFFVLGILAISLFACAKKPQIDVSELVKSEVEVEKTDKKIKVVSQIFSSYDWIKNVAGEKFENFDVRILLDKGNDLHSYQANAEDIAQISAADLFVYVGGPRDTWVLGALEHVKNKDIEILNLVELLGEDIKMEEMVEGMQEHNHDHDHEDKDEHNDEHDKENDDHEHEKDSHDNEHGDDAHDKEEHDHEHEDKDEHDDVDHDKEDDDHEHEHEEIDEHVWLSLKNAKIYVSKIEEALSKIDPENSEIYKKNATKYLEELDKLDKEYEAVIAKSKRKTIVVGDRFPFRYLVDDYDLDYYAAFVGCSAETEASFETVIFLANKLNELNLDTVLTIDGSNMKIAKTIVENTKSKDEKILELNSLQSTTKEQIENGLNYLEVMKNNLEVLKEILNK